MALNIKTNLSSLELSNNQKQSNLKTITNLLTVCKIDYFVSRTMQQGSFEVNLHIIAEHHIIELILALLAGVDKDLIKDEIISYRDSKK